MTQEQRTYFSISFTFLLIAILVALIGLLGSSCASWQSVARQTAFTASATAKVASEELPELLKKQCLKDTLACQSRSLCVRMKAAGEPIRACCPELDLCNDRAVKVQSALVAVNQGVLATLRLVEVGERIEAEGLMKGLLLSVGNLKKMMEELR